MRHAGRRKAGFYPTPPRIVELLKRVLRPPATRWNYHHRHSYPEPQTLFFLDPTCGDGKPLQNLGEAFRDAEAHRYVRTYGVELDRNRAAAARRRLKNVAVGDAMNFEAEGFGLLFLNPPYDDAGGGHRLEVAFLERFTQALVPGGVLVYIIPERSLPRAASYLLSHYSEARALRFPHPEYEAFQQVVVLAKRRTEPVPVEHPNLEVDERDLAQYARFPEHVYTVPASEDDSDVRLFDRGLEPNDYLTLAEASPAWATLEANARNAEAPVKLPPLVALTREHLALLVASGHLNETVVPTNEGPLLLRGRVRKVEEELPPESDDDRTVRRTRQRYLAVIQALNLDSMELKEIQ